MIHVYFGHHRCARQYIKGIGDRMIVVANGAFKSGSTWLFHIARELTGYGPPPAQYAALNWTSHPVYSVEPPLLAPFLDDVGSGSANVLTKNHLGAKAQRDLLLRHPQVRVLNITRDIRDVVVSAFYHRWEPVGVRDNERFADFRSYYWQKGRLLAKHVLSYQIVWDVRSQHYLCVDYATLLAGFAGEVQRIGAFLGVPPEPEEILRIQQATTPAALARRYGADSRDFNRFRKGGVGDWRNHFDEEIAADLEEIVKDTQRPLYRLALRGPGTLVRLYQSWRLFRNQGLRR
jgi:hypothetical protein